MMEVASIEGQIACCRRPPSSYAMVEAPSPSLLWGLEELTTANKARWPWR